MHVVVVVDYVVDVMKMHGEVSSMMMILRKVNLFDGKRRRYSK